MGRRDPGGVVAQRRRLFGPIRFFAGIVDELKKVTWPSRKDALRLTLMVVGVSIALGLVLGAMDYLFTFLAQTFLRGG